MLLNKSFIKANIHFKKYNKVIKYGAHVNRVFVSLFVPTFYCVVGSTWHMVLVQVYKASGKVNKIYSCNHEAFHYNYPLLFSSIQCNGNIFYYKNLIIFIINKLSD